MVRAQCFGASAQESCTQTAKLTPCAARGPTHFVLVTEYGYDPVQVRVEYAVPAGSVVEDSETGERLCHDTRGLTVPITTVRARLLWVH